MAKVIDEDLANDPQYIARLVGKGTSVSLKTVEIVEGRTAGL